MGLWRGQTWRAGETGSPVLCLIVSQSVPFGLDKGVAAGCRGPTGAGYGVLVTNIVERRHQGWQGAAVSDGEQGKARAGSWLLAIFITIHLSSQYWRLSESLQYL